MVVENAGLLTVAALRHLDCKDKNVVSVLSGGNMDVITMSSLVQHGLICRGRIFTFAVQLPDRPGELMRVASILAKNNGNIIKLEHNQFININRNSGVELRARPQRADPGRPATGGLFRHCGRYRRPLLTQVPSAAHRRSVHRRAAI